MTNLTKLRSMLQGFIYETVAPKDYLDLEVAMGLGKRWIVDTEEIVALNTVIDLLDDCGALHEKVSTKKKVQKSKDNS